MKQTIALPGALAVFAILSLSACANHPTAPRVTLIDVPAPVLQRVPADKIEPLVIPHEYPAGDLFGPDVENRLLACEALIKQANIDRAWIRERQQRRVGNE